MPMCGDRIWDQCNLRDEHDSIFALKEVGRFFCHQGDSPKIKLLSFCSHYANLNGLVQKIMLKEQGGQANTTVSTVKPWHAVAGSWSGRFLEVHCSCVCLASLLRRLPCFSYQGRADVDVVYYQPWDSWVSRRVLIGMTQAKNFRGFHVFDYNCGRKGFT